METNIATTPTTITLKSGFRRHATLLRFEAGKWDIVDRSSPNTWVGDGDSTKTVELPHGFQGAIVWHWDGDSNAELLGFTEEELASPAPAGWVTLRDNPHLSLYHWSPAGTMKDILRAQAEGAVYGERRATHLLSLTKGPRLLLAHLGYAVEIRCELGHQRAAAFVVVEPGQAPYIVSGTGDCAPYYLASEGRLTSEREEIEREEFERTR
jgi:hypothetical protein